MQSYIGTKIIQAEEMSISDFNKKFGKNVEHETAEGYHVAYPDGYDSWSPKDVFESAYRVVSPGEVQLITGTIIQNDVG